ncbi:hypothetical protein TorRG33x02_099680 [Trema orientale]|uniref:Uncharacterized protein n=1 Tax=Trema orientale TaxID=63057 RepID=A0A2P5F8V5_TREOI|nr:hypothetical protein TorRG33x02_099680 [Trema orientale]
MVINPYPRSFVIGKWAREFGAEVGRPYVPAVVANDSEQRGRQAKSPTESSSSRASPRFSVA